MRRAGAWVALAAACCCAAADREAPDVAVFTLSTIPVRADGAAVYELDAGERLSAEVGADLPGDPGRALAEVRRRLDARESRTLRRALAVAGEGNALASELGIERLPAVVVEGRYVVYGERDARRAVDRVAAWRRANETATVDSGPGNARSIPLPDPGTPPARSLSRGGDRR